MNSDIRKHAFQTIESLFVQLDPSRIKRQFDQPISMAAEQFVCEIIYPVTSNVFHQVISDFVLWIYRMGLNAPWKATAEPLGRAIELLEKHFQCVYGQGYIAAFFNANDPQEGGMDIVLFRLAEIIQDIERLNHVQAIFARQIDPTDWDLKCQITCILLDRYRPFLPSHMLQRQPWELANEVPAIIHKILGSDGTLQEIVNFSENTWNCENNLSPMPL